MPSARICTLAAVFWASAVISQVASQTDEVIPSKPFASGFLTSQQAAYACAILVSSAVETKRYASKVLLCMLGVSSPIITALISDARYETRGLPWVVFGVASTLMVSVAFAATFNNAFGIMNANALFCGASILATAYKAGFYITEYASAMVVDTDWQLVTPPDMALSVDALSSAAAVAASLLFSSALVVWRKQEKNSEDTSLVCVTFDACVGVHALGTLQLLHGLVPLMSLLIADNGAFATSCAPSSVDPLLQCPVETRRRRRAAVLLHPLAAVIWSTCATSLLALNLGPSKWSTVVVLPLFLFLCTCYVVSLAFRHGSTLAASSHVAMCCFLVGAAVAVIARGLTRMNASTSPPEGEYSTYYGVAAWLCAALTYLGLVYDRIMIYITTGEGPSFAYLTIISNVIMFAVFVTWSCTDAAMWALGVNRTRTIKVPFKLVMRFLAIGALSLGLLLASMLTALVALYDGSAIISLLGDATKDRIPFIHEIDSVYRFFLTHYAPAVVWSFLFDATHKEDLVQNSVADAVAWYLVPGVAIALYASNNTTPSLYPITAELRPLIVLTFATVAVPPWLVAFFLTQPRNDHSRCMVVGFAALAVLLTIACYAVLASMT